MLSYYLKQKEGREAEAVLHCQILSGGQREGSIEDETQDYVDF